VRGGHWRTWISSYYLGPMSWTSGPRLVGYHGIAPSYVSLATDLLRSKGSSQRVQSSTRYEVRRDGVGGRRIKKAGALAWLVTCWRAKSWVLSTWLRRGRHLGQPVSSFPYDLLIICHETPVFNSKDRSCNSSLL